MTDEAKRLYRSTKDRKIWGVCGGLAEYFNIDPVVVRVVFFILIFASGVSILAYIVLAIVTPSEPAMTAQPPKETSSSDPMYQATETPASRTAHEVTTHRPTSAALVAGVVLIAIGIILLFDNLFHLSWLRWSTIGPLILIIVGLLLFYQRRR